MVMPKSITTLFKINQNTISQNHDHLIFLNLNFREILASITANY